VRSVSFDVWMPGEGEWDPPFRGGATGEALGATWVFN